MQIVKDEGVGITARNIDHINSVGAIIDNSVLIHNYGGSLISIATIRKLEIHKTTGMQYNLISFLCAVLLVYIMYSVDFTLLEKLFIGTFTMLLLGLAIFFKKSKYTLLIKKIDTECIALPVNKHQKDAAKRIVRLVNKKIKQLK